MPAITSKRKYNKLAVMAHVLQNTQYLYLVISQKTAKKYATTCYIACSQPLPLPCRRGLPLKLPTSKETSSDDLIVLNAKFENNRPFARSGHMVRNKLHWDASYAVGLPKQRNSYQSSPTFLCFESPTV